MRWLANLKDRFTQLKHLFPVPNKEPKFVASGLCHIFGLLGYPLVHQSGNGNEVSAQEIIDMLHDMDPKTVTVTGRPRTPREQGSVERDNATVKRAIAKMVAERKRADPQNSQKHNWLSVCPLVMSGLNSATCQRGKSEVSPCLMVFGMPFDEPLCTQSTEVLRQHRAVAERANALDSAFRARMVAAGALEEGSDKNGSDKQRRNANNGQSKTTNEDPEQAVDHDPSKTNTAACEARNPIWTLPIKAPKTPMMMEGTTLVTPLSSMKKSWPLSQKKEENVSQGEPSSRKAMSLQIQSEPQQKEKILPQPPTSPTPHLLPRPNSCLLLKPSRSLEKGRSGSWTTTLRGTVTVQDCAVSSAARVPQQLWLHSAKCAMIT
jgi:hypothetical protein